MAETAPTFRRMLTTAEAAEYCGLSASYLYQRRAEGDGPVFLRIGRAIRYSIADLDSWLKDKRRRSTAEYGRQDDKKQAPQHEPAAA